MCLAISAPLGSKHVRMPVRFCVWCLAPCCFRIFRSLTYIFQPAGKSRDVKAKKEAASLYACFLLLANSLSFRFSSRSVHQLLLVYSMAAVSTSRAPRVVPAAIGMSSDVRERPSISESLPFSVSATFFQPRNNNSLDATSIRGSEEDGDEEEDEEEEEDEQVESPETTTIDCGKKIYKMTVVHGGGGGRKSPSPLREEATTTAAVENGIEEEVDVPDIDDYAEDDEEGDRSGEDDGDDEEISDQNREATPNCEEGENAENCHQNGDQSEELEAEEDKESTPGIPEIVVNGVEAAEEDTSSGGGSKEDDDESGGDETELAKNPTDDDNDDANEGGGGNALSVGKVQRKISRSEELQPAQLVSKIAEYERISTVGTGSFGRVVLVRHYTGGYYALKLMGIREVMRSRQVEHVHSEKNILLSLDHPFIIKLHWAYHDSKFLYMLFDYVPGGELFSYLRCARRFCNYTARFYAAEIILALEYLHKAHIVYRDLKPENILLDKCGHARLTDFGFAKMLTEGRTWTICGTPEYLAPEIIAGKGHNTAVDWWSLGVLIYEMLTGRTPFPGRESQDVYEQILKSRPKFNKGLDPAARDLIKRFLVVNRVKRLGNLKGNAADIKTHKWFAGLDWTAVFEKRVEPPIKPTVIGDGDTGNFDEYDEDDLSQVSEGDGDDLDLFQDW